MFTATKEIIWHLVCNSCKNWFTYATMEEGYKIDRGDIYCPRCGRKGRAFVEETKKSK